MDNVKEDMETKITISTSDDQHAKQNRVETSGSSLIIIFTRDSIYAIARICHANSVCPSVCLSHACIVSKWLNVSLKFFHCLPIILVFHNQGSLHKYDGFTKFVDFGTNRKRVCDFLLVINSNLGPILHRFGDTVVYWSKNRQNC